MSGAFWHRGAFCWHRGAFRWWLLAVVAGGNVRGAFCWHRGAFCWGLLAVMSGALSAGIGALSAGGCWWYLFGAAGGIFSGLLVVSFRGCWWYLFGALSAGSVPRGTFGAASAGVVGCCRVLSGVVGWCRVLSGVVGCCRVLSGGGLGLADIPPAGRHPPGWQTSPRLADNVKNFHNVVFVPPAHTAPMSPDTAPMSP